jgi:hypothetical protein
MRGRLISMTMFNIAFLTASVFAGHAAHGEIIKYEIYRLEPGGERTLLASGKREYTQEDVAVVAREGRGQTFWQKSVVVWDDFSVGSSIHLEHPLTGFGLWIERETDGFSWDWFDIESGDIFKKLQGTGRVRVETRSNNGAKEIVAVDFLTDVTLRGKFSSWSILPFVPFPDEDTHHLVVKKGSVLRFASKE